MPRIFRDKARNYLRKHPRKPEQTTRFSARNRETSFASLTLLNVDNHDQNDQWEAFHSACEFDDYSSSSISSKSNFAHSTPSTTSDASEEPFPFLRSTSLNTLEKYMDIVADDIPPACKSLHSSCSEESDNEPIPTPVLSPDSLGYGQFLRIDDQKVKEFTKRGRFYIYSTVDSESKYSRNRVNAYQLIG